MVTSPSSSFPLIFPTPECVSVEFNPKKTQAFVSALISFKECGAVLKNDLLSFISVPVLASSNHVLLATDQRKRTSF